MRAFYIRSRLPQLLFPEGFLLLQSKDSFLPLSCAKFAAPYCQCSGTLLSALLNSSQGLVQTRYSINILHKGMKKQS